MLKIQKFTAKGIKGEDVALPKDLDVKVNLPLLAQAVYVYENRRHVGLRKTKTRSEVNRTSKKLYKQKGTGGARHGSKRAPIFVGGGIALGPRPIKREIVLNQSMKSKAKVMAFSLKASEKEMVFVSGISKIEKTKEAGILIKSLEKATNSKRFTFVLSENAKIAGRSIANLKNAVHVSYKDANAFDIFRGGMIVMDEEIFESKDNKDSKDSKETKTAKTVKTKKATKKVKKEIKK